MGWDRIWSTKEKIEVDKFSGENLFLKLKEINGFDIVDGALNYRSFLQQHNQVLSKLKYLKFSSVFEVGCGSGANLLLFDKNLTLGGLDYSQSLIETANQVVNLQEMQLGEAKDLDSSLKYDILYSNSVFSYFPDLKYAEDVLNKIYEKTIKAIVIIDIHNIDYEEDYLNYRRSIIKNYDELYKGLNKLFYSKKFFEEFALKNNMKIEFAESTMKGYWNNKFVFNCYMYK
ncbi:methyltransferase [Solibacillus silvestris]|uniref:methyltransferase n=1 Tax=Solibacillus silvestris TaxID=76853 RepID=UPI003F8177B5